MKAWVLQLLPLLVLVSLLGCGDSGATAGTETGTTAAKPPNIVFILADDLGYGDLSCYGQTKFSTPNIDALAASGMRFTQHYAGSTVCAPSRSALMTGLHTGHTFVRGNKEHRPEGQFPLADSVFTLAEALREAGYVTGAFGKWGLGYPGSEGDPVYQGFDEFYGYNCQRMAHNYYPRHLWDNRDSIPLPENAGSAEEVYAPYRIHEQKLAFIEEHAEGPLFLYVPTIIPHAELIVPDSVLARFAGRLPEGEAYAGVDYGEDGYRTGGYGSQDQPHAAFVAMIDILDRQVGEIVAKLEEEGIADNTLIIFTSDNGPHLEAGADPDFFDSNGPLRGYKRDLYDGGIRVPMIASWPGHIAAGSESDHVSAFWDFFPTFAALSGASMPTETDGLSLLPTLLDEGPQPQHDYLYWEFHEKNGRQAVRLGDWKGVRYGVNTLGTDAPIELYDLATDIGETNNVADAHPEIVERIDRIMREARRPSDTFAFAEETFRGK